MTSFAADFRDLKRLADDPYRAFKESCADGAAKVRRAREIVEQHWFELPEESQNLAIELVRTLREAPKSMTFWQRVALMANLGWQFIFEPNRGVSEAAAFAVELTRFTFAVESNAKDQERRLKWLFENAPTDIDACEEAASEIETQRFTLDELKTRVAGNL